ncbi:MAG TPA: hypothetical protein VNQ79_06665 [Blastocatellia bacterium]|nr:hypothetical protein [Blastocatellia bacterium]
MAAYASFDDLMRDGFRLDGREGLRFEDILEAASRIVDDACEVEPDYFAPASDQVTLRSFEGGGTRRLHLPPYAPGSIRYVGYADGSPAPDYTESGGWLVAAPGNCWPDGWTIEIEARWGWPAVPADIRKATVQVAIMLAREDDPAYGRAVVSADGGASIVRGRAIPPTVQMICDRWKRKNDLVIA